MQKKIAAFETVPQERRQSFSKCVLEFQADAKAIFMQRSVEDSTKTSQQNIIGKSLNSLISAFKSVSLFTKVLQTIPIK